MKVAATLLPLLLAGCATYTPLPLGDGDAVLKPADSAALSRAAGAIDRPYLTPVAIDLAQPLDPNAIAVIAVIANPDLKAKRARAGVADAQAFAARLMPDPTFSIGASPVLSGPDPFVDIASSLGLDLNALRTRGVTIAAARSSAEQVRLDLAWAEWQTAGQARLQAVRILGLERSAALAAINRAAAASMLERTLRAAGRGDLAPDQVNTARATAFDTQDRERTLERDLAAARLELARLLGLQPRSQLRLAPTPLPAPPPDAEALFALARTRRTDLRALEAGYAAEEATVHKAVLDQFPALGLAINGNRDSAGNTLIGPAVSFTLPLWNRNRGGIAIERATRAALKAEYDARLFQTRADIAAAVGGIMVARRQRDALLRDLPAATRFAAASRRAADRGDLALATAETAEQAARDKQVLLAASEQDIVEQTIALELLTGALKETWPS
ncbi:TolC family protein [Sphingomonas oligophenolica]|uniref:TolC family protein n=1 Tax=Sphingomonas oligophenolica TaxID=301154 RepID=A0ABU9Y6T3_9SPHN